MSEAALQRKPLPTRLRERFRIIQALVDFQKSRLYPILFALMCVISATNGMAVYIPIFWLMTVLVVFSILFTDDTKVLLVPMFLGYYAVGCDVPSSYYSLTSFGLLFTPFHQKGLTQMLVCGSVMVAAFLIRIVLDGTVQKSLKNRNLCFWGIIALSIVLFTNGIFHKSWQPINLFYGMFISIGLLLFYALLSPFWKSPQDMAPYACHVLVCSSGSVLLQILIAAIRAHREGLLLQFDKLGQFSGIWRGAFVFSWGVTTIVGGVLVLGIPAALYLARNARHPLPYLSCAVLFFLGSALTNTRSAMIVGGGSLLFWALHCSAIKAKTHAPTVFLRFVWGLSLFAHSPLSYCDLTACISSWRSCAFSILPARDVPRSGHTVWMTSKAPLFSALA